MRMAIAMLGLLALAGCATDPAKLTERDDAQCSAAGLKPGSPDFSNCQMRLESQRATRSQRMREELITGKPELPR